MLDITRNQKHKTILSILYGCGLRRNEIIELKIKDIDLRIIQVILGDASSRTTEIYTHVSNSNISSIKSPGDDFDF